MSEEITPQEKPFLVIYNVHSPNCGDPPSWVVNRDSEDYLGYFKNKHGEQWIFVYDYETETGTLRGGDGGWDNTYPVVNGRSLRVSLGEDEQLWLRACWMAATAFKRDDRG